MSPRAEVLAVGTEFVGFARRETNSSWLNERLEHLGVRVVARAAVADDVEVLAGAISSSASRSELVVVTGGLGPTHDDRTREALARAFALPLEHDPVYEAELTARLSAAGVRPSEAHLMQRDRPRGATWLRNPAGTAPGILFGSGGAVVAALPGPPHEMRATFEASLVPWILRRWPEGIPSARTVLRIAGLRELDVEERVRDLYGRDGCEVTILAGPEGVELAARADVGSADQREAAVRRFEREVAQRLGADFVGADVSMAEVVGHALARASETVATAESCTAGLLAAELTSVPGSSSWFRGGLVAYADDLKASLAGVASSLIAEHGAVSEAVARALSEGARRRCRADWGIGVTGIAGPGGGTAAKPVGLVWIAVDHASGSEVREFRFPGDRDAVRRRSVHVALDRLRRRLLTP